MGMSSAQVIRDCQAHFQDSALFAPALDAERGRRQAESKRQRHQRGRMKREVRVKMGHGGTLDPLATGVLILGVGRGTKALNGFLECTKTYETVVLFGASTDTYDRVGRILRKRSYDDITRARVEAALDAFRGRFHQMPPLYSALKMDGKPLYEYAREGRPIPREIATREVEVSELELLEWYEPGTHSHRWPDEEAAPAEQSVAAKFWRREKEQQGSDKTATPEEEEEETRALEAHESFKREAEGRQDDLVVERPPKRRRMEPKPALMSGALGELPNNPPPGRGSNLIPPPPSPDAPPPWTGKGPPAARIRMTVTSGFYVRSFCHDLGDRLGSAALMAELCRTRQKHYRVGTPSCLEYDDLAKGEKVWGPKVESMLQEWQRAEARGGDAGQGPAEATPEPLAPSAAKAVNGDTPGKSPTRTKSSPRAQQGEESSGTIAPSIETTESQAD